MPTANDSFTSSSDTSRDRSGGWLLAAAGCALVVSLGLVAAWTQRQWLSANADPASRLRYNTIARRTGAWAGTTRPGVSRGVVFGDSVLAGRPPRGAVFPPAVGEGLSVRGTEVELLDLTFTGLDAFQFYYVLAPALAGAPRFAVVEVNLRTFAEDWLNARWLHDTHLAGHLSLRQVLRARAALAARGLHGLAPLAWRLEEATGMLFAFDGLRLASARALETLGAGVNAWFSLGTQSSRDRFDRLSPRGLDPETARSWYERDFRLADNTDVLRALRDELYRARVTVLFLVAPINERRLAATGIDLAELGDRVEDLRIAIGATAEEWIYDNASFSPRDFLDAIHLNDAAVGRLADLTADRLWRLLRGEPVPLPHVLQSTPTSFDPSRSIS